MTWGVMRQHTRRAPGEISFDEFVAAVAPHVAFVEKLARARARASVSLGINFVWIFGGAQLFASLEGWTYVKGLYFVTVTLTTIGLGDVVPATEQGENVHFFYCAIGLGLLAVLISASSEFLTKVWKPGGEGGGAVVWACVWPRVCRAYLRVRACPCVSASASRRVYVYASVSLCRVRVGVCARASTTVWVERRIADPSRDGALKQRASWSPPRAVGREEVCRHQARQRRSSARPGSFFRSSSCRRSSRRPAAATPSRRSSRPRTRATTSYSARTRARRRPSALARPGTRSRQCARRGRRTTRSRP